MKILSNELAQHYQITSLNRGHSVFTSFIAHDGKILFLDFHIARLLKGATFLFPELGWDSKHQEIKEYVEGEYARLSGDCRISCSFRLNIFDSNLHLERRVHNISPDSLKLTTAQKIKTPDLVPAFVKLPNYVESDLELILAKKNHFDDVLFFDQFQSATEASTSNLFIVLTDGAILTPPTSSMVLDGVTRSRLLHKITECGFNIAESTITKTELLKAREIWLTNSVKGLRFVDEFENKTFTRKNSLFDKVIKIFGRYGELV